MIGLSMCLILTHFHSAQVGHDLIAGGLFSGNGVCMNKIIESGGKENLKISQPRNAEIDWVEHDPNEAEENDITFAILDAHDDPC